MAAASDAAVSPSAADLPEAEPVTWARADGETVPGFAFGSPGAPGVIMVQEWWGVTEQVKEQAATLASKGFRTLVPDLYRGKVSLEVAEARHHFGELDWPGAVADIAGAAAFLKTEGSAKVGITGFCMGGALSLAGCCLVPDIACGAPFYGIPSPALCDVSKVAKPVQGHFGDLDQHKGFADVEAVAALEEKLRTAGVEYEIYRYPKAGHGFMNTRPEMVAKAEELGNARDPEAVPLAWGRLVAFFEKHLA